LRETDAVTVRESALCQACGACCAHSREWPRFTLEDDAEIDRIPAALINDSQAGMRCDGDRCAALSGAIGTATECTIYDVRPLVCRDCRPGDDACSIARAARGMERISSAAE
jgi:Fe-S-cluster containining protein